MPTVVANMAGLLKYFHHEPKQDLPALPNPKGWESTIFFNWIGKKSFTIFLTRRPNAMWKVWGVLEFNFHSEVLNRQACCRRWSNSNSMILYQSLSSWFAKLADFSPSGITVLVIHQFITAKLSLCRHSPRFYPTNILLHTVINCVDGWYVFHYSHGILTCCVLF